MSDAVVQSNIAGTFPLSTMQVQAFYASGITCRQILSWAAEIAGRFVRCNVNGVLYFDWYALEDGYRIKPSSGHGDGEKYIYYKQDGLHYENYETPAIDCVAVHPTDTAELAYIYPEDSAMENIYDISSNLLLTDASENTYMTVAKNVYDIVSAVGAYRPAQIKLFPFNNPFRAGQIVKVTDIQGVSFTTPVMSVSITEEAVKLESTGAESISEASDTIAQRFYNLADNLLRIKKLKVDWAEIDEAVINTLSSEGINANWINAGTINVDHIQAASIGTEKLKDDAVTIDKLAAGAVTVEKLAAGSVTTEKLAVGALTVSKQLTSAVTDKAVLDEARLQFSRSGAAVGYLSSYTNEQEAQGEEAPVPTTEHTLYLCVNGAALPELEEELSIVLGAELHDDDSDTDSVRESVVLDLTGNVLNLKNGTKLRMYNAAGTAFAELTYDKLTKLLALID